MASTKQSHSQNIQNMRVLLWGFGNMNKITVRYLKENGANVVGVIGRHNIGEDAGEIAGIGKIGVRIATERDASAIMKSTKPDACILATRSTLPDVAPALRVLGTHGVNTITLGEEVQYHILRT